MVDELDTKVVVIQSVLHGSESPDDLQKVATVYMNGSEYRVSAPPDAIGDSLEWVRHFTVKQLVEFNSEVEIHDAFGILAVKLVQQELEAKRSERVNPDDFYCPAQICLNGDVQHYGGQPFDSKAHCTKCGASCVDGCRRCHRPIRGSKGHGRSGRYVVTYTRPQFCHGCGYPYPWMEDRLSTARELLDHDDKLSLDDRKSLWNDLQYVMSDPKADLVPAKKKLIVIKLEKATVRGVIEDLIAKTFAEVLKS